MIIGKGRGVRVKINVIIMGRENDVLFPATFRQPGKFRRRAEFRIGRENMRQSVVIPPALPVVPDQHAVGQTVAKCLLQGVIRLAVVPSPDVKHETSGKPFNTGRGFKPVQIMPDPRTLPNVLHRNQGENRPDGRVQGIYARLGNHFKAGRRGGCRLHQRHAVVKIQTHKRGGQTVPVKTKGKSFGLLQHIARTGIHAFCLAVPSAQRCVFNDRIQPRLRLRHILKIKSGAQGAPVRHIEFTYQVEGACTPAELMAYPVQAGNGGILN